MEGTGSKFIAEMQQNALDAEAHVASGMTCPDCGNTGRTQQFWAGQICESGTCRTCGTTAS